jgi:hypothetical protein
LVGFPQCGTYEPADFAEDDGGSDARKRGFVWRDQGCCAAEEVVARRFSLIARSPGALTPIGAVHIQAIRSYLPRRRS